jgi:hypothetical protein
MSILKYFTLNEDPFRLGPDARFLYFSDQVKEALAKCEYMAKEGTTLHISRECRRGASGFLRDCGRAAKPAIDGNGCRDPGSAL